MNNNQVSMIYLPVANQRGTTYSTSQPLVKLHKKRKIASVADLSIYDSRLNLEAIDLNELKHNYQSY